MVGPGTVLSHHQVLHAPQWDRLDSTHPLTNSLLTTYYGPGTVLSSGETLGKKPDLLNIFTEFKAQKHG